jgi:uncharacterized membrane protein YqjE
VENSRPSENFSQPEFGKNAIDPLRVLRILRSAGSALCSQAGLYGQLARVEWAEEKNRLLKMIVLAVVAFACALCIMVFVGVLVLALSWESQYRIHAILAMLAVYVFGIGIAWYRLQALSSLGGQSFAATREEIAADIALIKSKL